MHFAARLLVGESVRQPLQLLSRERGRGPERARGDGGGRRAPLRLLVNLRDLWRADGDADRRDASAAADQRVRRDASSPSSARCRTSNARSASALSRCATSTPPAPIRTDSIGEDHQPEEHLIPLAIAAARGGKPLTLYGDDYDTPDGTCIRDYIHVTDLADAHIASLQRLEAGGASAYFNLGTGTGMSVQQVVESVARVAGRPVPHTMGRAGLAIRPGSSARMACARQELGWTPKLGELDTIVRTAWRWHERMPHGYSD